MADYAPISWTPPVTPISWRPPGLTPTPTYTSPLQAAVDQLLAGGGSTGGVGGTGGTARPSTGPIYGPIGPEAGPFAPRVTQSSPFSGMAGVPVAEEAAGGFNWGAPLAGLGGLKGFGSGLKSALPYTFAGLAGGQLASSLGAPSEVSLGLEGAGAGATIGSAIAPGPGTAIGAALGGLAGVAAGALGFGDSGDETPTKQNRKMRKSVEDLADQLNPTSQASVRATVSVIRSLPQDQRGAAYASLLQSLPSQIAADAQKKQTLNDSLAVQLQMANAMAKLGGQSVGLGDSLAASIRAGIPNAPAALQPLLEYDAANREAFGRQTQNAYVGAAMAQPTIDAFNNQIAQLRQIQQQQFSSNTGQSFQDLLNQTSGVA